MRRGSTRRRAVSTPTAVVAVAALAITGCTSDPGPTPTPSVTHEASPSPTSTPTPTSTSTPDASVKPQRPAAIDTADSAGAEAVAVYFLQLFPYVFATGDLEDYRTLSHAECVYCSSVQTHVEAVVAAGQRSDGGLGVASDITTTETDPGRWWLVQLTWVEQPSVTRDASGVVVEEFPGVKTYRTDVAVIREGNRWLVREVTHTRQDG